ncbi:MAG: UDP-N-acetylmuramate--L-alanine ligase [Bdellovibrionales bacterium]
MSENRITQSKVHLIGIGGIGMSGIAEILINRGAKVSGSDIKSSERTKYLEDKGVRICVGHDAENIQDADVVVYSSAIKSDNPEMLYARTKNVPTISRAEALAELMRSKRGVAIAGTHGKTTTTSMVAQIFESALKNPTVVSGGIVLRFGSNAKLGTGEWFIAEADESDGSFERLSPELSVITNVDNDHIEHYGSFANLKDAFLKFADRIPFYGSVIYCGDDDDCLSLFKDFKKKAVSYGFGEDNDFSIKDLGRQVYQITRGDEVLGSFKPPLPGNHNALNSLAAVVVGLRAGISFEELKVGIESFSGVRRRFEIKADFEEEDVLVIDDYAHHPTEIVAALSACKKRYLGSRVRCVFQPHRYSRLQTCWDQFKNAFDMADEVFLVNVYAAGEAPIDGFGSKELREQITNGKTSHVTVGFEELSNELIKTSREGDVIITLGAGDVYKIGDLVAANFKEVRSK